MISICCIPLTIRNDLLYHRLFEHEKSWGTAMDKDKLYELKAQASQLKPIINIGKNGITDTVVEEIKKHLKANRMIKIKTLKSSREEKDTESIANELASATASQIVEIRGNSLVLYK